MKKRLNRLADRPVFLFFFKIALHPQVRGKAELGKLGACRQAYKSKEQEYGKSFCQKEKSICNVKQINVGLKHERGCLKRVNLCHIEL